MWLSATHICSSGCWKLAPQWVGPFKVLEVKPNTLQIAVQGKIHPVINVSQLEPWIPTADGKVPCLPPITYDAKGEPEFEVENIVNKRKIDSIIEYCIYW